MIFLMTKAEKGDARSVRTQLEISLRSLNTDYLDLWQMHQVMSPEDVDSRIDNGVLDVFIEAKESGKVRHIGFTGHRDPAAHLRVLERTDIFETCQMPVNCADPSYGSFIRNVMPALIERNIGLIGMKTLAHGGFFGYDTWLGPPVKPVAIPERVSVQDAIHFAWSYPISVLVTGPDTPEQLQEKIDLAHSFTELSEEKRAELVEKVADLALNHLEYYKAENLTCVNNWKQFG